MIIAVCFFQFSAWLSTKHNTYSHTFRVSRVNFSFSLAWTFMNTCLRLHFSGSQKFMEKRFPVVSIPSRRHNLSIKLQPYTEHPLGRKQTVGRAHKWIICSNYIQECACFILFVVLCAWSLVVLALKSQTDSHVFLRCLVGTCSVPNFRNVFGVW